MTHSRRDFLKAAAVVPLGLAAAIAPAVAAAAVAEVPVVPVPSTSFVPRAELYYEGRGACVISVDNFRLSLTQSRIRTNDRLDYPGLYCDQDSIVAMLPQQPLLGLVTQGHHEYATWVSYVPLQGTLSIEQMLFCNREAATRFWKQFGNVCNAASNNVRLVGTDWAFEIKGLVLSSVALIETRPGGSIIASGLEAMLLDIQRLKV